MEFHDKKKRDPKLKPIAVDQKFFNAGEQSNPYLTAKASMNHWFYDMHRAKRNWQCFATLIGFSLFLALCSIMFLIQKSKFIPYVVQVDRQGDAQFVNILKPEIQLNINEYRAFLYNYVMNAFRVINDSDAQKHALDAVYASTSPRAIEVLNHYFKVHDPFVIAKMHTKEITVNSILPKSDGSWQVKWTETKSNHDGRIEERENYEALITIKQYQVEDYQQLLLNPLGLFVDYITWSVQR